MVNKRKFDPYHDEWSRKIRKRDKVCQFPGCKNKKQLQAHHIIPYTDSIYLRYEERNGCALCKSCHKSIQGKELQFAGMFMEIVARKYK